MKKPLIILLHIGYWILYWFLFTFLYFISRATAQSVFDDDWAAILLLATLTGFISFYLFYFWLVPYHLTKQNLLKFIGFGLVVSISTAMLIVAGISMTVYSIASIFPEIEEQTVLLSLFSLLALVNGILGTIIRGFILWYTDIHVKEVLENRTLRTELALLKAQINPHFLFNTLNNIDVLIEHDTSKASLYLNKLSDLLRFVLYETQADQIPLTQELEYIEKYIDLQKLRTTNGQYVTLQINGRADGVMIAPMLFISYIENAFKYAANKKTNEAIRILISIGETQIRFQCINVVDRRKVTLVSHNGIGNDLIRQRLSLLYKAQYQLTIQEKSDEYAVDLLIPRKHDALSPH